MDENNEVFEVTDRHHPTITREVTVYSDWTMDEGGIQIDIQTSRPAKFTICIPMYEIMEELKLIKGRN